MPTYEYRCPDGHEFERFYRKISDAIAELPCPECGKPAVRQLSGGAGFLFKGTGFYLTDYGKNAHRKTGAEGVGDASRGKGESGEKGGASDDGGSKPSDSTAGESKTSGPAVGETKSSAKGPAGSGSGGEATSASTSSKPAGGRSSGSSSSSGSSKSEK